MTSAHVTHYTALAIGGFQCLANAASLARGVARLPQELAAQGATARIADLLRAAWVYGTLGNLCVSVTLLLLASALRNGEPLARHLALAIGIYYLLLGGATYWFAEARHPGFLMFSVLGAVLLTTLWLSR